MKINMPPTLEANKELTIPFEVEFRDPVGFNGNEEFFIRVIIESLRFAQTELKVELFH